MEKITFDGKEYEMNKAAYARVEEVEKLIGENGVKAAKKETGIQVLKIILKDFDTFGDEVGIEDVLGVINSFFSSPFKNLNIPKKSTEN